MVIAFSTKPFFEMNNSTITNISSIGINDHGLPFKTVIKIESVSLPIICLIGLLGNTLSTITFLRHPLRKSPCSLYLAARGVSDNGFLLSLLLIWTSSTFNLRLSQVKGVCQLIVFMTYLCGCVSVWLCVFISFENFLLIYNPFIAKRICTTKTSKICIFVLTMIAVTCYQTSLWIMNGDCSHNANYSALTQVLVFTDTLFTLVVPTILIFVLLFVITYRLVQMIRKKQPARFVSRTSSNSVTFTFKPHLPISKITKMLFIVSLTFFILNVPSHVIRLRLLIGSFIQGKIVATPLEGFIQIIFQLIYYTSFSVNIIVYLTFGSNFRKTFKATFGCKSDHHLLNGSPKEAVNLVRRSSYRQSAQRKDEHIIQSKSSSRKWPVLPENGPSAL